MKRNVGKTMLTPLPQIVSSSFPLKIIVLQWCRQWLRYIFLFFCFGPYHILLLKFGSLICTLNIPYLTLVFVQLRVQTVFGMIIALKSDQGISHPFSGGILWWILLIYLYTKNKNKQKTTSKQTNKQKHIQAKNKNKNKKIFTVSKCRKKDFHFVSFWFWRKFEKPLSQKNFSMKFGS